MFSCVFAALVQGPPGTGKSATIVGIILQIWGARGSSSGAMPRILVVAPSNAAVDELALKLLAVRSELPENKRFNLLRLGNFFVFQYSYIKERFVAASGAR